jgi:SNF2 family DNA or RNA helicase
MLQTEVATSTGGFEADEMGLGKTIIALASVVVVRDECHEAKNPTTCSLRILRRLRGPYTIMAESQDGPVCTAQTPPTWFMSGTPFETSPGDLCGYLEVLERPDWPATANLQDCTSVAMSELGQRFSRAGSSRATDLTGIIEEFHARLRALPFLRRQLSSKWNGQFIVTLPPHTTVDVDCKIHAGLQKQLERLEASVGRELGRESARQSTTVSPQFRSSLERLRVLLSFPNLCMFYKDHPELPLTIKDLGKKGWDRNPDSSWFAENIQAVVQHSTKFEEIRRIIRGLGEDYAGRQERLVILSMYPVVALIMHLVCDLVGPSLLGSQVTSPVSC